MKTLVLISVLLPLVSFSQKAADSCPSWGAGSHKSKPAQPDFIASSRPNFNGYTSTAHQEQLANFATPKYQRLINRKPVENKAEQNEVTTSRKIVSQLVKKQNPVVTEPQEFKALPPELETAAITKPEPEVKQQEIAPVISPGVEADEVTSSKAETVEKKSLAEKTIKDRKLTKHKTKRKHQANKKISKGNNQKCPEF